MTITTDIFNDDKFSAKTPGASYAKPRRTSILRSDLLSHRESVSVFPSSEVPSQSRIIRYGDPRRPWDDIYAEMPSKDPDLSGMIHRYIWSVISLEREIIPHANSDGSISDGAQEAADLCSEWFGSLPRDMVTTAEEWILWKYFQGGTVLEFNWDDTGSLPIEIKPRDLHDIAFTHGGSGESEFILNYRIPFGHHHGHHHGHVISEGGIGLEVAPIGKFLFSRYGVRGGIYGYGMSEDWFHYWRLKLYALMDWAQFVEAEADPTTEVTYNAAESDPQNQGKELEDNQRRESKALEIGLGRYGGSVIAHDHNTKVNLLESQRQGVKDIFSGVYLAVTRAIARLVHLESTTSDDSDRSSPLAAMQVTRTISNDRTIVSSESLGDTWRQIFSWVVGLNLPGAPVPGMILRRSAPLDEQKETVASVVGEGFPDVAKSVNEDAADQLIDSEEKAQ